MLHFESPVGLPLEGLDQQVKGRTNGAPATRSRTLHQRPQGPGLVRTSGLSLVLLVGISPLLCCQQAKPDSKTATSQAAPKRSQNPNSAAAQEEAQALQKAVTAASGNPQVLIKNLQAFLVRFPASAHRTEILNAIFKQALQSNEPQVAIAAGEQLASADPEGIEVVSQLVDLLDRQDDPASRAKAVQYASRFVDRAEKISKPADLPARRWPEAQMLMRAAAYALRAKVYARSGEGAKALADYARSYGAYPTSTVAERMGDLEQKQGDAARAVDAYATAFVFPEKTVDLQHREQLRRKLGSVYLAKNGSEKGLGDLLLARYDGLMGTLQPRFSAQPQSNSETDTRNPFDSVLRRTDGSEVRLGQFRGKIVVMDFWATWCGPCRAQGKLLEQVYHDLQKQPVAFLAVNVDEDRTVVPEFIKREQWTVPVVYGDGLDHLLSVTALPTLMILDRQGKVILRAEGLNRDGFTQMVEARVKQALEN